MASSTGDDSMLSDEQAEPEWAATPARSSPMSTGSASTPCHADADQVGQPRLGVGVRRASTPSTAERGLDDGGHLPARRGGLVSPSRRRSPQRGGRGTEGEQGRQRLEPGAAPAPARRPRGGARTGCRADDQGAGPRHPAELVRTDADEIRLERGQVRRHVAARRRGVDVHRDAGRPAQRDHLADRLQRPHLVVAPLAVHQRRAWPGGVFAGGPRSASACSRPSPRPPGSSSGGARRAEAARTVECSTAAQSTGDSRAAPVAPHTAALMASVAPEVKTTWRPATPNSSATCPRATSSASRTTSTLLVHPVGIARRQRGPPGQRSEGLGPRRCGAGVVEIGASHGWLRQRRCRRRRPAPARRGSPGAPGATPCRTVRTTVP